MRSHASTSWVFMQGNLKPIMVAICGYSSTDGENDASGAWLCCDRTGERKTYQEDVESGEGNEDKNIV